MHNAALQGVDYYRLQARTGTFKATRDIAERLPAGIGEGETMKLFQLNHYTIRAYRTAVEGLIRDT